MRHHLLCWLILLAAPLSGAAAQQADSSIRADSLRHRIEERFASRVQEELELTDAQTAKLRATSQTFGARRRELLNRERALRDAREHRREWRGGPGDHERDRERAMGKPPESNGHER